MPTVFDKHMGFILTVQAVCAVEQVRCEVKPWRSGAGYDLQVGDRPASIHYCENPEKPRVARKIGLREVNGMLTFTPA
jgi:hypothetical protein